MTQVVWLIITGIIRVAIVSLVTFLASKGVLDVSTINPYLNDMVATVAVVVVGALAVLWHWAELHFGGLTKNSPYPPSNLPGIQTSTATLNSAPVTITTGPKTS
jgi:hypothetical protein